MPDSRWSPRKEHRRAVFGCMDASSVDLKSKLAPGTKRIRAMLGKRKSFSLCCRGQDSLLLKVERPRRDRPNPGGANAFAMLMILVCHGVTELVKLSLRPVCWHWEACQRTDFTAVKQLTILPVAANVPLFRSSCSSSPTSPVLNPRR